MGLSANVQLLSITARLTSNEYQTQRISNAKMRLATQSEEASDAYIAALNTTQMTFTTYDAKGNLTESKLTAGVLYQYADMKNQYALVNTSGQTLVSQSDAFNFKQASNLDEFLASYGVVKEWKSTTLQDNYDLLNTPDYQTYMNNWKLAIQDAKDRTYDLTFTEEDGSTTNYPGLTSDRAWELDKSYSSAEYQRALKEYKDLQNKIATGIEVPDADIQNCLNKVNAAKGKYTDCITYDNWLMSKAAYDATGNETEAYKGMKQYYEVLEEFNAELEDYGTTLEDGFAYNDSTKAQWYTNLWYRLNGPSSEKSLQGSQGSMYQVLDEDTLSNSEWLQKAIKEGTITIEMAANEDATNLIPDETDPTVVTLEGISWKSVIYSSCTDIQEKDDEQAIARAEAEYQKATQEINAKDEKYQSQIKTLDTEHTALQTEYESVQSALNKNIERSFKAFS